MGKKKEKLSLGANPARMEAVRELRRSGASGSHSPLPRKQRTRSQKRGLAIKRSTEGN